MAKKNNRQKSKATSRPAAKPVEVAPEVEETPVVSQAAAEPRAAKAPKLSRSQAAADRIEDEYAYILGDLRRVLILAAIMFALLIVVNIVLSRMG